MTVDHVFDIGGIISYLKDDAEVAALVGTRVFGFEIPGSEADDMPRATVLINDAGLGNQDGSWGATGNTLKDVRCYADSPYESARLFDLVRSKLKQLTRTEVTPTGIKAILLYSAIQVTGRFTTREPDTEWPVSFGTFNIMVSEG
jgi:hypothetical protein